MFSDRKLTEEEQKAATGLLYPRPWRLKAEPVDAQVTEHLLHLQPRDSAEHANVLP